MTFQSLKVRFLELMEMDEQLDNNVCLSRELRDFFRSNIRKEMDKIMKKMVQLGQTCS